MSPIPIDAGSLYPAPGYDSAQVPSMNQDESNSTRPSAPSASAPAASGKPSVPPPTFWAVAIVLVVAMVCLTYVVSRMLNLADRVAEVPSEMASTPARVIEGIAQAFKSTVNVRTTIDTAIGSVRKEASLVVLKSSVNVTITKSSEKNLWGKIYLGTTTVTVRAMDNRVQYVVPLEKFGPSDIRYEPGKGSSGKLIVKIPVPRLDNDLVEVQSDPSKISIQTDVGWARLDSASGKFQRDEAMRELRPAVIQQGKHPLLMDKARAGAKEDMLRLLSPLVSQLREGVSVVIEFDEPGSAMHGRN